MQWQFAKNLDDENPRKKAWLQHWEERILGNAANIENLKIDFAI